MVCLPPSPLPPSSHIKAQLFTLEVSKAGPRYPLLPDPFPEGQDYPGVHQRGGVRGAPRAGTLSPTRRLPHPCLPHPCLIPARAGETPLRPVRWDRGCAQPCVLLPRAPQALQAGCSQWSLDKETRGSARLPHGAATVSRGDLRIQQEGNSEGRELS